MLHRMSISLRKFVAVLLMLWLPLFSGNAMALSLSMQLQTPDVEMSHDSCHEMQPADPSDQHSCLDCGVCHLACSAYLGVQTIGELSAQPSAIATTPYFFAFHSITSTPLVPPPLA